MLSVGRFSSLQFLVRESKEDEGKRGCGGAGSLSMSSLNCGSYVGG